MNELLPCPFCGSEAHVCLDYEETHTPHVQYVVQCFSCFVTTQQFDTEAEAIEAWNTRAAYETDDYFYLPKPKERLITISEPIITETENGVRASYGIDVFEKAVRKWQEQIECDSEKEIIERICEVFRPKRTCENISEYRDDDGVLHRDARIFRCSECGFKVNDFYGDDEQNFPNYCPNCGRKVIA